MGDVSEPTKSVYMLAKEVNEGLWGKGAEVKRRLIQAGHNPFPVLYEAGKLKRIKKSGS